jgi:hypothetical protein
MCCQPANINSPHRKKINSNRKKSAIDIDGGFLIPLNREKTYFSLKRNHGFSNHTDVVYKCLYYKSIPHMDNFFSLMKDTEKEV